MEYNGDLEVVLLYGEEKGTEIKMFAVIKCSGCDKQMNVPFCEELQNNTQAIKQDKLN